MSLNVLTSTVPRHEEAREVYPDDSDFQNDNSKSSTERENHRGSGRRLLALDAARGLAVIGMFLQHFALNERNAFVAGNTTLLFVLCGGISYSIMAQRMKERGEAKTIFRSKMLARAVFVDVIGYLLIMLNTPYGIILPAYAAMFVLGLVLINRSTRVLVYTTVALWIFAPPLMILGMSYFSGNYLLQDMAGGPISALALAPAFVAGMTIARFNLTNKRIAMTLVCAGFIMLIIGKLLAIYVLPDLTTSFEDWLVRVQPSSPTPIDEYAIWPNNVTPPLIWHMLLQTAPHTASSFQMMIGVGIAFLVIGLAFLIPRKISVILTPFASVGRVALTMYAAQFIIVWVLTLLGIDYGLGEVPLGDLIIIIITLLIGSLIALMPNGPLESMMRCFDRIFSSFGSASTK
ncbi:DUF418 domain-containing protein [Paenibacillus sp. ACRRY]|uniref:DUF418 domain-containing protein n=1 Tax=Paenibacillus sp. ACRRY TaxID=2918208 RepID=UPI001EF47CDC|nr:DUF418 domain-containing protein [Paenibacillus sp. ACRRY]MCG7381543.1 DUF418 domain-containing protein [Paenibacillus sp. ACRRY]